MTGVNLLAVCEALTFGKKGRTLSSCSVPSQLNALLIFLTSFASRWVVGLDLNTLHTALTGGAANSWALDVLGKKMIDGDFKVCSAFSRQDKTKTRQDRQERQGKIRKTR